MMSTLCRNATTSNAPSGVRNFSRFSDARLQAESSRNMYSLHGFEALIRPVALHVCHLLMVVSNCMPGSPHCHADAAIFPMRSRARYVLTASPFVTFLVVHSLSSATARMKSSPTRTLLFAFWKKIEE